jgi:AbrB family looped-hinge helix DNA binding protein
VRTTTISGKGQVTLPAALLRERHLEPGTTLLVVPVEGGIMLMPRPASLTDATAGATAGTYGDAVAYVDAERGEWT